MATVGTNDSADAINGRLCTLARQRAALAWAVLELANYVDKIGDSGLELAGFDSGQATTVHGAVDLLKTDAQVFLGQATQGSLYDFADALGQFIGPTPPPV
jgi:hypothetical protein